MEPEIRDRQTVRLVYVSRMCVLRNTDQLRESSPAAVETALSTDCRLRLLTTSSQNFSLNPAKVYRMICERGERRQSDEAENRQARSQLYPSLYSLTREKSTHDADAHTFS